MLPGRQAFSGHSARIDLTRKEGIASHYGPADRPGATRFTKVYRTVAPQKPAGCDPALCYSLHVQRETAFNVSAIKDTVLRSIKLNQQAYNNRDADVLREVYLEPMLSQVAHDLSGDFESFPAARLDITCEVLDVSYTAYLQIGKVELSAYGLEASPQNVNVTTKEEWIYRLVPDAEKGVGLGRRTDGSIPRSRITSTTTGWTCSAGRVPAERAWWRPLVARSKRA